MRRKYNFYQKVNYSKPKLDRLSKCKQLNILFSVIWLFEFRFVVHRGVDFMV
jgi:hypothetical protein